MRTLLLWERDLHVGLKEMHTDQVSRNGLPRMGTVEFRVQLRVDCLLLPPLPNQSAVGTT